MKTARPIQKRRLRRLTRRGRGGTSVGLRTK